VIRNTAPSQGLSEIAARIFHTGVGLSLEVAREQAHASCSPRCAYNPWRLKASVAPSDEAKDTITVPTVGTEKKEVTLPKVEVKKPKQ